MGAKRARLGGLVLALAILVAGVVLAVNFFQVYALAFWGVQVASAERTSAAKQVGSGDSIAAVTAELGPPAYEAPGFTIDGHVRAAVQVWELDDDAELRVLVLRDRVAAAREGVWRVP